MVRRTLIGLLALTAAVVAGWFVFLRRGGQSDSDDAVQWPFDADELRSVMSKVVADQSQLVSSIQDAAGRNKAQAFLDYYERRRRAAAS